MKTFLRETDNPLIKLYKKTKTKVKNPPTKLEQLQGTKFHMRNKPRAIYPSESSSFSAKPVHERKTHLTKTIEANTPTVFLTITNEHGLCCC